jgi:hypothetical protein
MNFSTWCYKRTAVSIAGVMSKYPNRFNLMEEYHERAKKGALWELP